MRRTNQQILDEANPIAFFVRTQRKRLGCSISELAHKIGVGERFLRELELGKKTVRMDKVNQVLNYFGMQVSYEKKTKSE